jgi:hypothetical protein
MKVKTFAAVSAVASAVNPLSQVIDLLNSQSGKITAEGEKEAKVFKEFFEWCDDAAANLRFEIKTATAKKEELEATIAKSASDIEEGETKIEELAASIAKGEADLKAITEIREKERAEFQAAETELVETVDALDRAIAIIGREMAKNPAAFAQFDTSNLDKLAKSLSTIMDAASLASSDKSKLMALVQSQQGDEADEEDLSFGAPAAAVYKSKSGGIMDVLEDLKEKAESELADLRKAEGNAKHNYEMTKQSLVDQSDADDKDLSDEKAAKAAAEETKATAEGDLAVTTKDLANANSGLETANGNCMTVAGDHEATVAARKEELGVIATAIKILKETSDGAASQTYSFFQVESSLHTRADLANIEVVTAVKKLAKQQHSAALSQLASRIEAVVRYGASAGEDPFAKVKELISNMIAKLEKEAGDDATEKAYCDEEMAKTEAKKQELDYDLETLTSKIDRAASASAKLKEEVKELQAELAELQSTQIKMDKIRAEESADYMQAKTDLELGLKGVGKALEVLRDYYGGGAAFIENDNVGDFMQQPAVPEQHTKSTGAGQSIINMLEVVESDFSKNLATEEAEEADSQVVYDKTTQENKVTKTMKEQDVKYKTQEFKSLDKTITELTSDKDTASTELSAVMEYYGKLKDRCVAKPETYAERARRRDAEIVGLKDALSILEEETAFVQRKKGRGHAFLG